MRLLNLVLVTLLLAGCEDKDNLPLTKYELSPKFSDFNLSEDYIYWEVRRGNMAGQDASEDTVQIRYDDDMYINLSEYQLELLTNSDTNNGFKGECLPSYCPIYGVGLLVDSVFVIESKDDLLTFLGSIDTPAELALWSSAQGYELLKYDITEYGYRALVSWDNNCGKKGKDLVDVYSDGTISLVKEISSEDTNYCV
ncbi:hypothetical protein [Paraglaciecola sp.]|uniref:hypothetical protein n=1 Tax=Paraglaciecola sp. TaxID=1920173 RepID=UPI003EF900D8